MNWEHLLSLSREGDTVKRLRSDQDETRLGFEVDYDRIIFSSAFRSLQDKTQVVYEMVDVWLTTFYETQSEAQMNAALDAYVGKSESVVSDRNITSGDSSAESNYDDEEFIQNTILLNSAFTTTIEEELVNLEAQKT